MMGGECAHPYVFFRSSVPIPSRDPEMNDGECVEACVAKPGLFHPFQECICNGAVRVRSLRLTGRLGHVCIHPRLCQSAFALSGPRDCLVLACTGWLEMAWWRVRANA